MSGNPDIFAGLYRGVVRDNDDKSQQPPRLGRVKIDVPQVYGPGVSNDDLPWAYPCFALGASVPDPANPNNSVPTGLFAIPSIGTPVWVAFEHGDCRRPVYMGSWIGQQTKGQSELPAEFLAAYPKDICWYDGSGIDGQCVRFHKDSDPSKAYVEIASVFLNSLLRLYRDGKVTVYSLNGDISVQSLNGKVTVQSGQFDTAKNIDRTQSIVLDPSGPIMQLNAQLLQINAANVQINSKGAIRLAATESITAAALMTSGFERHDLRGQRTQP